MAKKSGDKGQAAQEGRPADAVPGLCDVGQANLVSSTGPEGSQSGVMNSWADAHRKHSVASPHSYGAGGNGFG